MTPSNALPPLLDCPFCEPAVELVTLQRDPDDPAICVVTYFHEDGNKHFISYQPQVIPDRIC